MRYLVLFTLKFIFAIICLYLLFQKIDFTTLQLLLGTMDYSVILVGLCLTFVSFIVDALRNHILFKPYSNSFIKMLKLRLAASSINNLLPSSLSGDLYVLLMFGKDRIKKLLTRNLFLLFFNFYILLILSLLAASHLPIVQYFILQVDYVISFVCVTLSVIVIFLAMKYLWRFPKLRELYKFLEMELSEISNKTLSTLTLCTFLSMILRMAIFYYLLMKLNYQLSFFILVVLIFSLNFLSLLPLLFAGFGFVEVSLVTIFSFLSVDAETAFIIAALNRIYLIVPALFGIIFLVQGKEKAA